MKNLLPILLCLFACTPAFAKGHLTQAQTDRVRAYKQLIKEADPKTLAQSVAELEKSASPEMNLQIKEAVAQTYAALVVEHKVKGKANKEWLLSMVTLNMAYLQFEGDANSAQAAPLDILIRQKLKAALRPGTLDHKDFHHSLE